MEALRHLTLTLHDDVTLVSTITAGFAIAFPLGLLAHRLRLSPIVGYLLSGVILGRFTAGHLADSALAGQLAQIGIMLLMFGVGLHFSLSDLMAVRRIAVPGAVAQILISTTFGAVMAKFWGWNWSSGLVLGLSLSVASTVVVLKTLEERNSTSGSHGRVAIGWLIVEDLVMVFVLVLLPGLAEAFGGREMRRAIAGPDLGLIGNLALTLFKVVLFVATILKFGPRVLPWLLRQVARTGSRELFTLCVLAVALGIAFVSARIFGVSVALGAFFAGVVLTESDLSHKAAANSLPLQDAFAVLFFVSVGMLFDPSILITSPFMVAGTLLIILVGKFIAAFIIILALGYPATVALTMSAALAQIGEFSFVLAGIAFGYGLLPSEGLSLVLAGALFSITINPLAFAAADFLRRRLRADSVGRAAKFHKVERDLEAARAAAAAKATRHKAYSASELAERFPLFAALTPEQRETVALHFQPRAAEPGERLVRIGDKADMIYFISMGEVEVVVSDFKTKLAAGNFFGEIAMLTGGPRLADVVALDYCKLLTLNQRDFRELLRRYPAMRAAIEATASQRAEQNRQARQQPDDEIRGS